MDKIENCFPGLHEVCLQVKGFSQQNGGFIRKYKLIPELSISNPPPTHSACIYKGIGTRLSRLSGSRKPPQHGFFGRPDPSLDEVRRKDGPDKSIRKAPLNSLFKLLRDTC